MPNSLLKQQRFPTDVTLVKINLGSILDFILCNRWEKRKDSRAKKTWDTHNKSPCMLQNAEKMGEEAVYHCPHQLECCGVTPAPGCAHHCRGRGAMSRGPCTRWIPFLGGCSAAGLWELWRWTQDRSGTSAALYHPAVSQSQTGCNNKTNIVSYKWSWLMF